MTRQTSSTHIQPKTLIVGIYSPLNTAHMQSYFEEFANLVRANGMTFDHTMHIKLRQIDPGYYIGKGKLEELISLCDKEKIERVIISEPLSNQQSRNLDKMLGVPITDRTELILEIFERGAQSAEGKLQVEIAALQHRKARLSSRGVYLSQQSGTIGTRGPGETQKEIDTQHLEHLMVKIRKQLKQLQHVRETQRKQRIRSNIPLFCLIGYTNAGKSTILNALTKSNVYAADQLFATLDTTTRELYLDGVKKGLISDTVGFIQQLPHHLVEAFKSTLSELQYAHLLLHVIDSADPNWPAHIKVVHEVLRELEVDKPMLYIFNKIDRVTDRDQLETAARAYKPHVLISALTPEGIKPLVDFLQNWKQEKVNS
jgi:GTP-binding protein HflX